MTKCTSTTRKTTKTAAPRTAAITTWIGLSLLTSCSWSAERRMPRKDHATARNVWPRLALRAVGEAWSLGSVAMASSGMRLGFELAHRRRRRGAAHLEEGVRQRDGLHVARQLAVHHEDHRPALGFARRQRLLGEAEAFHLG